MSGGMLAWLCVWVKVLAHLGSPGQNPEDCKTVFCVLCVYHRHHMASHLAAFRISVCHSPLIITMVLFIFTIMPLFSTLSFHSLNLLIRSSSVSANTTKLSAYNNSHSKATPILYIWLPWQSQITVDSMLNFGAYRDTGKLDVTQRLEKPS